MSAPTVGLAIIARNEEQYLPGLLASISGAFDEVVLLDTGSTDDTVAIFEAWAELDRHGVRTRVGRFEWCDDFAAARAAADKLLTTDWRSWADCDDQVVGADQLRAIAAAAPDEIGAFFFRYDYAQDPETGACICELWRERLIRREIGRWVGRVHESIDLGTAAAAQIAPERCQWRHRKPPGEPPPRNLDILQAWAQDEPDNERVIGYLGVELAGRGRHEEALEAFGRYLVLHPQPDHHRLQTRRRMCASLLALERPAEVPAIALAGIAEDPTWPESHLSLAEAAAGRGEWAKALDYAQEVVRRGKPDSFLILNPLDFTVAPLWIIATAHAGLGNLDEACRVGERAQQLAPQNPALVAQLQQWRGLAKHEHSVSTWLAAAQMLVQHDEQLKALILLEQTVPFFVVDHPRIVAARSELRERLGFLVDQTGYEDLYRSGGPKPEALVADGDVDRLCRTLPRAGFLLEGLREQDQLAAEAA